MSARIVEGVDWPDHANYWQAGDNAVMITDAALYRNGNYHTSGDTETTLDHTRMGQVVGGAIAAVRSFTETEHEHD